MLDALHAHSPSDGVACVPSGTSGHVGVLVNLAIGCETRHTP